MMIGSDNHGRHRFRDSGDSFCLDSLQGDSLVIYDITEKDLKQIASLCYEPQKLTKILDKCRLQLAEEVCLHPSAERVKLAETEDANFQHMQFGFRCTSCGKQVDPLIVGYVEKKYV